MVQAQPPMTIAIVAGMPLSEAGTSREAAMKAVIAGAALASLTTMVAWNDPGFWVIKDSRQPKCSIVTQNPVVDGSILWSSGPYSSQKDAEIAISNISACN